MKRMVGLILVLSIFGPLDLRSQPEEEAGPRDPADLPHAIGELYQLYRKAMARAEEPILRLDASYRERLELLQQETQESGDLEGVLAIREEVRRTEENRPGEGSELPELARLQQVYHEHAEKLESEVLPQRIRIEEAFQESLEEVIADSTREGKLEDAVAGKRVLDASAVRLAEWRRILPTMSGNPGTARELDWEKLAHHIATGKLTTLQHVGGGSSFRARDRDVPEETSVLVGFEVFLNPFSDSDKTIRGVIPIYRTESNKLIDGLPRANTRTQNSRKIIAKRGYAVGAISAMSERAIRKFKITFHRIDGFSLDGEDAYESDWLGEWEGGRELTVGAGGKIPVGVDGYYGLGLDQLALIVVEP